MSSSNSVTVQILDKEYSIICPQEERSNLVSAARYLDGKMREIRSSGKVIGADRIAVMAALNITHDLLHKQERPDVQASGSTREQVRDLLDEYEIEAVQELVPEQYEPFTDALKALATEGGGL